MSSQPIEALLRPPVEVGAITTNLAIAIVAAGAPQMLLVPGGIGYGIAAYCLLRSLVLGCSAVRLLNYQRRLRVLPTYIISPARIRASSTQLFLGRGFQWDARHTQRFADISRSEYSGFDNKGSLYKGARKLIDGLCGTPLRPLLKPLNSQWLLNPFPPRPYVEGSPELHGVGLYEKEQDVFMQQSERVAHTFVVGTTRVGKTRLLEVLATQDIRNGDAVVVFDPKGDGDLLARLYTEARRAGREGVFQVFHLGFPEHSVAYNPVGSYSRITEVATRVAGQLPNEGNSVAFREFAWRYVNVIARALEAIGEAINYENLLNYGADIDELLVRYLHHFAREQNLDDWEADLAELENSALKMPPQYRGRKRSAWAAMEAYRRLGVSDGAAIALIKVFEHDKTHFDKLVASLFPLLEKLTSGPAARLLSPENTAHDEDSPDSLSWRRVIERGGIVYVGLDALSDAEVAAAVGNAMFADLTSLAGSIYKDVQSGNRPRKICVHADEFNELVGREFVPLANKAGGAGFQLTVYTQTLSDIVARFGNQAQAGQVIGNLGTLIMLRVKEQATAELLTSRLKDVEINHMMLESGSTDSSNVENDIHFVSNTRHRITSQRVPLIHPGDLDALPKGHAFALAAGRLYKLRLPLFDDDAHLPSGLEAMVGAMRQQHEAAPVDWAEQAPLRWQMDSWQADNRQASAPVAHGLMATAGERAAGVEEDTSWQQRDSNMMAQGAEADDTLRWDDGA
ncbi:MAG: type IV conjugative transfer system coupling protein TraD [Parahaliea sp.]